MKEFILFLLAFGLGQQAFAAEDTHKLKVNILGPKAGEGQIIASLFNSEASYMKSPLREKMVAVGDQGTTIIYFDNLPAGEYAVSVIHDKDADGKLDTNFLGIPTEKIGFSNNAKPKMGPAPYKKSRFTLANEIQEISIALESAK